jgi:3-hydroxyisobutyrate dehydrogenase-like beta-hydroxyacid dehydrogenase
MISSVAVIAPGAMGSAVAYRLSEHGIHVLTSLRGREPQTLRRAAAAKMQDADDDAIARADIILSILPPAEALALAERFAAPLSQVPRKAIFVDCNAVNVETVLRISSIIEPTGASFVDGSIIGPPPGPQGGPTFYFSGSVAKELAAFEGLGLKVRIMEAPIGAAKALKMAYAGIVTAMVLGAARAGSAVALHEELAKTAYWTVWRILFRICSRKHIDGAPRWKRSLDFLPTIRLPVASIENWQRCAGGSRRIALARELKLPA